MLDKLRETLTSRKLWAAVLAAVLAYFGVDPEVVASLCAYIVGQGIADAGAKLAMAPSQQKALVELLQKGIAALNRQAEPTEAPSSAELVK